MADEHVWNCEDDHTSQGNANGGKTRHEFDEKIIVPQKGKNRFNGFINFSVLYSWGVSWEISFAVAFVLGFLFSSVLDKFLGKEFDKHEAEKISSAVRDFEDRSKD